ncbi:MAG: hypothetical protein ACRD2L_21435, partial [Terriglobia bacterium]
FSLPWLKWVCLLDSAEPRNQKYRGVLPLEAFDDYANADWYVVWTPGQGRPKCLTSEYQKVWAYQFEHLISFHLDSPTSA